MVESEKEREKGLSQDSDENDGNEGKRNGERNERSTRKTGRKTRVGRKEGERYYLRSKDAYCTLVLLSCLPEPFSLANSSGALAE